MKQKLRTFCCKKGYQPNLNPVYFIDNVPDIVYQPDVYNLAYFIADRLSCEYIIDVGCGNGLKLQKFQNRFKIIAIDNGINESIIKQNIDLYKYIDINLEEGLPYLDEEWISDSVIIVSNVLEHLLDPDTLLLNLSDISNRCHALIISTPERDLLYGANQIGPPSDNRRVREWNEVEFRALLKAYSFPEYMIGLTINNDKSQEKNNQIILLGKIVYKDVREKKRVLTIINCYNEEDFIGITIDHLLNQGVDIHISDNWSTDRSFEIICRYASKYPERITFERFPAEPSEYFEWELLLRHSEEIAQNKLYDWYILYDVDEIRESPWYGTNLVDAISFVDSLDYNAIEFMVLDFRPTLSSVSNENILEGINFFWFRSTLNNLQLKAWKSTEDINISSSGGHTATYPNRKVFPLRFIMRHYPIRSHEHGIKKIYGDRLGRFSPKEKDMGWHNQYDRFENKITSFLWDKAGLIEWDPIDVRFKYFVEIISGNNVELNPIILANYESLVDEYKTLRNSHQSMQESYESLAQEYDYLAKRYNDINNSNSWKITRPLRFISKFTKTIMKR